MLESFVSTCESVIRCYLTHTAETNINLTILLVRTAVGLCPAHFAFDISILAEVYFPVCQLKLLSYFSR